MSWVAIAKKDVQDSVRSKTIWALIAVFLLLMIGLAWLTSPGKITDTETLLAAIGGAFLFGILFFVPIMGLVISIKSIIRERESGTINLLLSLPHTRLEMIIGKFVGRSVVLTIAILATFLPSVGYIFLQADSAPMFELGAFLFATMLFGLMFVGIGVGFSALVNSETQAAVAGILLFFALYLWPFIIDQLGITVGDFVSRFWLLFMFADMMLAMFSLKHEEIPDASVVALDDAFEITESLNIVEQSVAIYLQHWFAFIILAIWIVVPLAVGYARFNMSDL
jgi:ABC-2 type transport system permease protein